MAYIFLDLDIETRSVMINELELDIKNENLYFSSYLKKDKHITYIAILKSVFTDGNEETFIKKINEYNILHSGSLNNKKIPKNSDVKLATTEFNHYYIRALCKRAIKENLSLEVYRANNSKSPSKLSEKSIGKKIDPEKLYKAAINRFSNKTTNPTIEENITHVSSGLSVKLI